MDASLITLIINCLLALFVFWGFLWGVGRGAKKSLVRLIYFCGFVLIVAIITPFVAGALLNIPMIEGQSPNDYLAQYINDFIASDPNIQTMYESSQGMQDLVAKLPQVLVGLVLFIVLVVLAKFFSWIGFRITCAIHFKKPKKQAKANQKIYTVVNGKPVITTVKPEKKHRWLGGLIGAVQGLVILFVLLLPITGVIRTVGEFVDTSVQQEVAEETAEPSFLNNTVFAEDADLKKLDIQFPEIARYLSENNIIPAEVSQIFNAYNNTIMNKIFSLGDFDVKCFDSISSITLDGQRTSIRHEIYSFAEAAESVVYVSNFYEDISKGEDLNWRELDFDKIEKSINALFDSDLIKTIGMDLLSSLFDSIIESDDMENMELGEEIENVLKDIKASLGDFNPETATTIKNNILAVVGVAKVACQSGVVDYITTQTELGEEVEVTGVFDLLITEDKNYIKDVFDSIFRSNILTTAVVSAINEGIGYAEKEINKLYVKQGITTPVVFDRVNEQSTTLWIDISSNLTKLITDAYKTYVFVDSIANNETLIAETENLEEQEAILKYAKFVLCNEDNYKQVKQSITKLGESLNMFKNISFLQAKNTVNKNNIFDQFMDAISKLNMPFLYSENSRLNTSALKTLDFVTETNKLIAVTDYIIPILNAVDELDDIKTFNFASLDINTTYGQLVDKSLKTIVNNFFTSPLMDAIMPTAMEALGGELDAEIANIVTEENKEDDVAKITKDVLIEIKKSLKPDKNGNLGIDAYNAIKDNFLIVFDVLAVVNKTGLINSIIQEEKITADLIYEKFTSNPSTEDNYFKQAFNAVFSAELFKGPFVTLLNGGLEVLANDINKIYTEQEKDKDSDFVLSEQDTFKFAKIINNANLWNGLSTNLSNIIINTYKVYQFEQLTENQETYETEAEYMEFIKSLIESPKLKTAIISSGKVLDEAKSFSLFTNTEGNVNILNQYIHAFAKLDTIKDFADLSEFDLNNISFEQDFNVFNKIVDYVIDEKLIDLYLEPETFDYSSLDINTTYGATDDKSLKGIVEDLFDTTVINELSSVILSILEDNLTFAIDKENKVFKETPFEDEILKIFTDLNSSYDKYDQETFESLQNDIGKIVDVIAEVNKAGIIDYAISYSEEEQQGNQVYNVYNLIFPNETTDYINNILIDVKESNTLKTLFISGLNFLIGFGEEELNNWYTEQGKESDPSYVLPEADRILIDEIKNNEQTWYTITKDKIFSDLIKNFYKVYAFVDNVIEEKYDLNKVEDLKTILNSTETNTIFTTLDTVGTILNEIFDCPLFTEDYSTTGENLVVQLTNGFDKIEYVKEFIQPTAIPNIDFKTEFTDHIKNLITFVKPIIDSEDLKTFNYSALDFDTTTGGANDKSLKTILTNLFNSDFAKLISTEFINDYFNECTTATDNIYTQLAEVVYNENNKTLFDIKADLNSLTNILCEIGKVGVIELLVSENQNTETQKAEISAVVDSLITKDTNLAPINKIINEICSTPICKVVLKNFLNDYVIPEISDKKITASINSAGFNNLAPELNSIIDNLIFVYNSLKGEDGDLQTVLDLVTEPEFMKLILDKNFVTYDNEGNLGPSTLIALGEIIDTFAGLDIFKTEEGHIIEDFINDNTEVFEDFSINIDLIKDAYFSDDTTKLNPNILKEEFTNLAPAIYTLNNIKVGDPEQSLFLNIIEGGQINLETLKTLTEQDISNIVDGLIDCKLIQELTITTLNEINVMLVSQVDNTYPNTTKVVTAETNLTAQKAEIKAVLNAGIELLTAKVNNAEINFGDLETAVIDFSTYIKAFLLALQDNSGEGELFSKAFTKITAKVSNALNDVNKTIIELVDTTPADKTISGTTLLTEWDEIITVLQKGKELNDALDGGSFSAVLENPNTEANQAILTKINNLLIALENNSDEYSTTPITYEYFHDAYLKVSEYVSDELNTKLQNVVNSVGGSYVSSNITSAQIIAQWDDIVDILIASKPFMAGELNINTILSSNSTDLNSANPASLKELLNTLKDNKNNFTESIFGTAYDAIMTKVGNTINDQLEDIIVTNLGGDYTRATITGTQVLAQWENLISVYNQANNLSSINTNSLLTTGESGNAAKIKALLTTLNFNFGTFTTENTTLSIFANAYTSINYIISTKISNQLDNIIKTNLGVSSYVAPTDINGNAILAQWDDIVEIYNLGTELGSITADNMLNETNEANVKALLTALKDNKDNFTDSIFGTAYDAIMTKVGNTINDQLEDIIVTNLGGTYATATITDTQVFAQWDDIVEIYNLGTALDGINTDNMLNETNESKVKALLKALKDNKKDFTDSIFGTAYDALIAKTGAIINDSLDTFATTLGKEYTSQTLSGDQIYYQWAHIVYISNNAKILDEVADIEAVLGNTTYVNALEAINSKAKLNKVTYLTDSIFGSIYDLMQDLFAEKITEIYNLFTNENVGIDATTPDTNTHINFAFQAQVLNAFIPLKDFNGTFIELFEHDNRAKTANLLSAMQAQENGTLALFANLYVGFYEKMRNIQTNPFHLIEGGEYDNRDWKEVLTGT